MTQPQSSALEIGKQVISPLINPLATTGIIFVVTIFALLQKEDLRDRAIRLLGSHDLQRSTLALDDAGHRLSRYFLTQLGLNTSFGVIVGAGLYLIGVPHPVLWGILGALLRFIPYIGSWIAALLPGALAAAVQPGWAMAMETVALYAVVELIMGQIVEPLVYGHSTGLSPLAVVIAAIFWTWVWGPIGLIISTPLTLCLVVLGRHVQNLEFLDVMLGDRPVLSPEASFYQRLLADDPDEAEEQAERYLAEKPLLSYYDEVVLKGLQLAAGDIARGALTPAQIERLKSSTMQLIGDLAQSGVPAAGAPRPGSRKQTMIRCQARRSRRNGGFPARCCALPGAACWTRRRRRCWPNCCMYAVSGRGPSPMLPSRARSSGPWTCARPNDLHFLSRYQRQSRASAIPDPPLARAARRGPDPGRVMAGGRRDIAGSGAASGGRGRLLCQHVARSGRGLRRGGAARRPGFVATIERLLVAVDASPSGQFASRLVGLLAGARHIPTTVIHFDYEQEAAPQVGAEQARRTEAVVEASADEGEEAGPSEPGTDPVEIVTKVERPDEGTIQAEASNGYDFLMIGREPASEGPRFHDQILRSAAAFDGPFGIAIARGPDRDGGTEPAFQHPCSGYRHDFFGARRRHGDRLGASLTGNGHRVACAAARHAPRSPQRQFGAAIAPKERGRDDPRDRADGRNPGCRGSQCGPRRGAVSSEILREVKAGDTICW